jgi:hypothetical protein
VIGAVEYLAGVQTDAQFDAAIGSKVFVHFPDGGLNIESRASGKSGIIEFCQEPVTHAFDKPATSGGGQPSLETVNKSDPSNDCAFLVQFKKTNRVDNVSEQNGLVNP